MSVLRILTFTLGAFLTAYSLAGSLSETYWRNDAQVNRVLCNFLLCDNAPLVWQGRDQLASGKENDVQQAITTFRNVLQRDPQDPYRWAELGDAFLKAGNREDARYCFGQVLILAPHTAVFLLRVAEFHFQIGDTRDALPVTARILALIPDYDSVVFGEYIHNVENAEDVLQLGLPEGSRASKSWLRFLMNAGRLGDAQLAWDWALGHGYADSTLAGEYANFLVRQGHPDLASSAWIQAMGPGATGYDNSTFLFNGDFESEPARSPFDWDLARTEGVAVSRDCTTAAAGKCSLQIRFAGTQNLDVTAASQLAVVRPGAYRFRAFIRTEAVSTDEGIRFRISDAEAPARFNEVFGQFIGTSPWSIVDHDLVVPPQTRLLRIEVVRQPSMKFDNKVSGSAWIDELKLESAIPHSPQSVPTP